MTVLFIAKSVNKIMTSFHFPLVMHGHPITESTGVRGEGGMSKTKHLTDDFRVHIPDEIIIWSVYQFVCCNESYKSVWKYFLCKGGAVLDINNCFIEISLTVPHVSYKLLNRTRVS